MTRSLNVGDLGAWLDDRLPHAQASLRPELSAFLSENGVLAD
jgi:hypothetical protein